MNTNSVKVFTYKIVEGTPFVIGFRYRELNTSKIHFTVLHVLYWILFVNEGSHILSIHEVIYH